MQYRLIFLSVFFIGCSSIFTKDPDCFRSESLTECLTYCRDDASNYKICSLHVDYLKRKKKLQDAIKLYMNKCEPVGREEYLEDKLLQTKKEQD